ncbi:MAG: type VI secretion system-associated FHA domain protein TagH [Proteobacteria bacterium]|nr:type VI secretion system-associated FHA domain protein TagH [Pseudomonadota bacterium]
MPLQIEIVSKHAELVGNDAICEFSEDGGTIGRSLRNDWILPDPDNFISGRHATIDYQGGIYYLADISSNGVYINDEDDPVGKGNPRRLFNGDRLRMGDFEMLVTIDTGEGLELPEPPKPTVVPDHIEQLVDEVSLRTGVQLLDEEEITGDDEFHSTLFGKPADKPEPKPKSKSKSSSKSKKTKKSLDMGVTAEDLFDSFLDGLGISRAELNPSVNRPEMMLAAGQVLREFVAGTTRLLSSRANLKNAFRLDQTTVLPRANNPIKFSENTNDLIKQLLVGSEGEYLGAQDAVREVCGDLLNHQNAFLDAMNSAFIEFADRFDPVELQEGFDRTISSRFFSFATKVKYWQLYCDVYPIMTEKGGGRFPQMFGEEFVKAYERQVAEYRRLDGEGTGSAGITPQSHDQSVEPDLMKTQKLVPADAEEMAFDDDDIVATISESGALEIDQSFIDDLENSMSEAVSEDDLKP